MQFSLQRRTQDFCSAFHRPYLLIAKIVTIPDSSCAGTKKISDRAFVHTQNADYGSIFMPERAMNISDRFFVTLS